jgi:flagellar motor switch protein FliN/FliY
MDSVSRIPVQLTVVLGRSTMPVRQLLRMGRGAVIELDSMANEKVEILANNMPIAKGDVVMQGDKIAVTITGKLSREEN